MCFKEKTRLLFATAHLGREIRGDAGEKQYDLYSYCLSTDLLETFKLQTCCNGSKPVKQNATLTLVEETTLNVQHQRSILYVLHFIVNFN